MNPILKSVVLGYQFDHPAGGKNHYIDLEPDQKQQADAMILEAVNRRFPFSLRRRWLLGRTDRLHAKAATLRTELDRMLREVDAREPLSTDGALPPFCSYVVIRGGHRLSYSFALNEDTADTSGTITTTEWVLDGGTYNTGTATTPTVTVEARGYVTASWEHPIPLGYYSERQLIERLLEQQDEEEGRVPALLAKLFHE